MEKGFEKITFKNGVIKEIGENIYLVKTATKESDSSDSKNFQPKEKKVYRVVTFDNDYIYLKVNKDQEKVMQFLVDNNCLENMEEISLEDIILEP